jgi:hypothetical protein
VAGGGLARRLGWRQASGARREEEERRGRREKKEEGSKRGSGEVSLSHRPRRRQQHASLREINGKHGDTHQCVWLEEEDKMEILQKYP